MRKGAASALIYGGIAYPAVELAFRGGTHFSMAILGAVAGGAVYFVNRGIGRGKTLLKMFICAVMICEAEFICGAVVNLRLGLGVWDYSDMSFNILGQVCLLFGIFWFFLSFFGIMVCNMIDIAVNRKA